MSIDTTSLFLHVLAAIGLVGGGIVQVLAGYRVRAVTTGRELVSWASFTRSAGNLIVISALVSLFTGGHLAGAVWTTDAKGGFEHPFITLGLAALLLLAPIGPMVGGAQLRRLLGEVEATDAPLEPATATAVRSPRIWGPVHSLVGVGAAIVALMVYKPSWIVGAIVLFAGWMAGWATGIAVSSDR